MALNVYKKNENKKKQKIKQPVFAENLFFSFAFVLSFIIMFLQQCSNFRFNGTMSNIWDYLQNIRTYPGRFPQPRQRHLQIIQYPVLQPLRTQLFLHQYWTGQP